MLPVASCALEKGFLRDNSIDLRNTHCNRTLNHVHIVVHVIIGTDIEMLPALADAFPLMLIVLDAMCLTLKNNDDESTATVLHPNACCSLLLEVKPCTTPFCCFSSKIVHYFTDSFVASVHR